MIEILGLLRQIFARHGLAEEFQEQEPLFLWEEAVGERIAKLASPLRVREGILFVEVKSHVLAQELSLLKEGYIRKLNKLLGEERVRDIRFRVGVGAGAGVEDEEEAPYTLMEPPPPLEEVPLSPEEQEEIAGLVREIEDERLREALRAFLITERRIEKVRLERGFKRCHRCGGLYKDEGEVCLYCRLESGGFGR
ncbi:MAG: DUF721 domain-containing protein [Candidatus Bipolaricaulia bacterium]